MYENLGNMIISGKNDYYSNSINGHKSYTINLFLEIFCLTFHVMHARICS